MKRESLNMAISEMISMKSCDRIMSATFSMISIITTTTTITPMGVLVVILPINILVYFPAQAAGDWHFGYL